MAARERSNAGGLGNRGGRRRGSAPGVFWLVVAFAVVLTASLIALSVKSNLALTKFEEGGTLCPEPKDGLSRIPELMVILLDSSDELGEAQQIQVSHELERLRSTLPKFGRLDVYKTSQSELELVSPVLTICNPGDGSDLGEITGNPEMAKKRWRVEFEGKVRRVLKEGVEGSGAKVSPIFETIQAAAVRTFDLPALDQVGKRRLVVVSDLLQNTQKQSHYQELPNFAEFRTDSYYDEVHADLHGVQVQVLYLSRPRASGMQGRAHIDFWDKYFESLGARVEEVKRISGQAPEAPVENKS